MANEKVVKIQDIAEDFIRIGGYKAFSFREIARLVGIKSASIHYHFPSKEDLAVAVAKRYTARFMAQLAEIDQRCTQRNEKLQAYIQCFRNALQNDGKMCLCGALAAESADLPDSVRASAKTFFDQNLAWLTAVLTDSGDAKASPANDKALYLLALLEGAMLMTQTYQHIDIFERIVASATLN